MTLLQGFGCTYSYCGKYESCTDCVTDPFCGWCDSSRSCVGGFADGPPKVNCPDWFYYHCYTVGNKNPCSSNIFVSSVTKSGNIAKSEFIFYKNPNYFVYLSGSSSVQGKRCLIITLNEIKGQTSHF